MRGSQEPIDLLARNAAGSHIRVASQVSHSLVPWHHVWEQMREASFGSDVNRVSMFRRGFSPRVQSSFHPVLHVSVYPVYPVQVTWNTGRWPESSIASGRPGRTKGGKLKWCQSIIWEYGWEYGWDVEWGHLICQNHFSNFFKYSFFGFSIIQPISASADVIRGMGWWCTITPVRQGTWRLVDGKWAPTWEWRERRWTETVEQKLQLRFETLWDKFTHVYSWFIHGFSLLRAFIKFDWGVPWGSCFRFLWSSKDILSFSIINTNTSTAIFVGEQGWAHRWSILASTFAKPLAPLACCKLTGAYWTQFSDIWHRDLCRQLSDSCYRSIVLALQPTWSMMWVLEK